MLTREKRRRIAARRWKGGAWGTAWERTFRRIYACRRSRFEWRAMVKRRAMRLVKRAEVA